MALIIRQSQIAETQRQRAERRFADVRKLAGSFLFEFHDAIKYLPGSTGPASSSQSARSSIWTAWSENL